MSKSYRPVLNELIWVTAALVLTLVICRLAFLFDLRGPTLSLHLHDTYFVFPAMTIVIPVFLLMVFLIYLLREIPKRFTRSRANAVLLSSGILLIIFIALLNKEVIGIATTLSGGWTAYPPLSALPDVHPGIKEEYPIIKVVANFLIGLQLMVTFSLLFVCFRWGQGKLSS